MKSSALGGATSAAKPKKGKGKGKGKGKKESNRRKRNDAEDNGENVFVGVL